MSASCQNPHNSPHEHWPICWWSQPSKFHIFRSHKSCLYLLTHISPPARRRPPPSFDSSHFYRHSSTVQGGCPARHQPGPDASSVCIQGRCTASPICDTRQMYNLWLLIRLWSGTHETFGKSGSWAVFHMILQLRWNNKKEDKKRAKWQNLAQREYL